MRRILHYCALALAALVTISCSEKEAVDTRLSAPGSLSCKWNSGPRVRGLGVGFSVGQSAQCRPGSKMVQMRVSLRVLVQLLWKFEDNAYCFLATIPDLKTDRLNYLWVHFQHRVFIQHFISSLLSFILLLFSFESLIYKSSSLLFALFSHSKTAFPSMLPKYVQSQTWYYLLNWERYFSDVWWGKLLTLYSLVCSSVK